MNNLQDTVHHHQLQRDAYEKLEELEAEGVYLSCHGNHACPRTEYTIEDYHERKEQNRLFDWNSVSSAMEQIPLVFATSTKWNRALSYGLKHALERWRSRTLPTGTNCYIREGDFIMAAILSGLEVTFKKQPNKCNSPTTNASAHIKCGVIANGN